MAEVAAEVMAVANKEAEVATKVVVMAAVNKAAGVATKVVVMAAVNKAAGVATKVEEAAMVAVTAKLLAVEHPQWEVVTVAVNKAAMVVAVQCDPQDPWAVAAEVVTDQLPMVVAAAAVVVVVAEVDVGVEEAIKKLPLRLTMNPY